ncbi:hypothetical protein AMD01_15455 [Priestia koreensis]|uniref:Uncharacterized protein n=2 Tax=Priestia koreensis TaxID=284581 RepID=A0A0M0KYP0_9BACI|nr:hypothetical protein AMD01_15455 [Priestia koreensis]
MFKSKLLLGSLTAFALAFAIQTSNAHADEVVTKNSNGIEITETEYQNLTNLGFSDLAINQMDQEAFDENKDLKVDSQVETTKYYEVKESTDSNNNLSTNFKNKMLNNKNDNNDNYTTTELTKEEYYKRVNKVKSEEQNTNQSVLKNGSKTLAANDTSSTSYRKLTTSIQRIGTTLRLFDEFVWDVVPSTRSYDVLTTSIDSTFSPVAGSQHGQQIWSYTHPKLGGFYGDNAVYNSSSTTWNKQSAGYGVKMNLKDDTSTLRVTELEGYMYYNITRNSSVIPKLVNAYGNYSHAKSTVSSSYSYSLSFGGPAIGWSGVSSTSFDQLTTHAQTGY